MNINPPATSVMSGLPHDGKTESRDGHNHLGRRPKGIGSEVKLRVGLYLAISFFLSFARALKISDEKDNEV